MAVGDITNDGPPADAMQLQDAPAEPARRKKTPQWAADILPSTRAIIHPDNAAPRPHDDRQDYLIGVRGVLVIMSFLWVFMNTFQPATVVRSANTTGANWQTSLRNSLGVIFWNDALIYGSIIFLSARTICLPFLLSPTKVQLASSVFRRGFRLWLPTALAMIVVYIVFTHAMGGSQYLVDFATFTGNLSLDTDIYLLPSSLANFNAFFEIFWISHTFQAHAGNWAFPTQMMWVISAVFQQSYTVFAAMVVIPYTRQRWRVLGAFVFILAAWWVYSWAWYSITGLLIADAVINMDLRPGARGAWLSLGKVRVPFMAIGVLCFAAGFAMQFVWAAARPDLQNAELYYHTGLYSTGGLQWTVDTTMAQIRADCYLIIVGFFLILETSSIAQTIFRSKFLVQLGKRSLGYFLLQPIIIYTLGITVAMNTMAGNLAVFPKATGIAFVATLFVTIAAAEVVYWLVDRPSHWLGRVAFDWIRR